MFFWRRGRNFQQTIVFLCLRIFCIHHIVLQTSIYSQIWKLERWKQITEELLKKVTDEERQRCFQQWKERMLRCIDRGWVRCRGLKSVVTLFTINHHFRTSSSSSTEHSWSQYANTFLMVLKKLNFRTITFFRSFINIRTGKWFKFYNGIIFCSIFVNSFVLNLSITNFICFLWGRVNKSVIS